MHHPSLTDMSTIEMMDYEATRAEFEGYQAKRNAPRPATGLIYWMLNNAWSSLHWNLFDYYLHPAGSYFGAKVGSRIEHVAYDYNKGTVYLINHSLNREGAGSIDIELIGLDGRSLAKRTISADIEPNVSGNVSRSIGKVPGLFEIEDAAFLRLLLRDAQGNIPSRNIYWLSASADELDWDESTWSHTPQTSYADFTALDKLKAAPILASVDEKGRKNNTIVSITLRNEADVPAFFFRFNLVDGNGEDVVPVVWSDNYVTLWPHEELFSK
ncbi:hypothetical protein LTR37_021002 [Vermiconidia calcicola]|uniref:Uncharacterized protein n=1 Tax=Vermiconidia calcicola TaxID=1690605 RepID=A0ACC3MBJ8_9PEZI|nr:hypothetical protein LTR37_021002 [Vermiconidia calcicola]